MRLGPAARKPGADAEDVLAEVGLADAIPSSKRNGRCKTQNLPSAW